MGVVGCGHAPTLLAGTTLHFQSHAFCVPHCLKQMIPDSGPGVVCPCSPPGPVNPGSRFDIVCVVLLVRTTIYGYLDPAYTPLYCPTQNLHFGNLLTSTSTTEWG
uniref:Uncharacterized protein n=1 Tax=Eutreptiella gymnastica TaxID=73025 RepID=A0A7S1JHP5_9EUGL|mmetsp:Transcript_98732/g.170070  ORF Transcript_98732/g.170070 Transcript_98732/m.170070 type:complete len:105 (+) Transcript_98732:370-684(+)